MNISELLLRINNVNFSSLICQTEIQTPEDKTRYAEEGYVINLTETEFRQQFDIPSHCVWYTPSISCSCLYFNPETLAAAYLPLELYISGLHAKKETLSKGLQEREHAAASGDYMQQILCLPDGMRMEYFNLLVERKPDFSDLYDLFFSIYLSSDYGFGKINSHTFQRIMTSKTEEEKAKTAAKLQHLPNYVKIYRGGNSASTPYEQAYSWSLDINTANFFACRHGYGEGYIVEGVAAKEDIIEAFLDDRHEQEVIIQPQNVEIVSEYSLKSLNTLKKTLPEIAPLYHKYRNQLEHLSFAQDSSEHGHAHEARVLLLCLIIAHMIGLPPRDQRVLATAAIYHDTQRTNDSVDEVHGRASAEFYMRNVSSPDPMVSFLCEYHCLPDEEGYKAIRDNRNLSKNRSRSKLLYDLFKDADALDRVRFGIRALDINQLRLPISKELPLIAKINLEQIEITPIKDPLKASLSSKISDAAGKAAQLHKETPACLSLQSYEH